MIWLLNRPHPHASRAPRARTYITSRRGGRRRGEEEREEEGEE